jgi:hypothetical protein
MFEMNEARQEYLARQLGDLGKNILTAACVSYFFEKFPLPLRFGICIMGVAFLIAGYLIQPSQKGVEL